MLQAAYKEGTHRTLMDQSRDGSLFDRSSFTRTRVIASKGSWNAYVEWQTSLVYEDWPGAAKDNSIRFNLTKTLPVGF